MGVPAGRRLDPVLAANVRWLAGYRHRGTACPGRRRLRAAFAVPGPLMGGASRRATRWRCCRCCFTCCGGRAGADLSVPLQPGRRSARPGAARDGRGAVLRPGTGCSSAAASTRWSAWPGRRSGCVRMAGAAVGGAGLLPDGVAGVRGGRREPRARGGAAGCSRMPPEALAAARELGAARGGGGDRARAGAAPGGGPARATTRGGGRWRADRAKAGELGTACGRCRTCAGALCTGRACGAWWTGGRCAAGTRRAGATPGWSRRSGEVHGGRDGTSTGTRARLMRQVDRRPSRMPTARAWCRCRAGRPSIG